MARFHVFAFSGNTLMTKMYLGMVSAPAEDEQFAFFKSRTLYMPYSNQPVETLSGPTVDLSTLQGDWLLVVPTDVLSDLRRSAFWRECSLVATVEVGMFDPTLAEALLNFINGKWGHLTTTE
jgi:hypothetical protein